MPRLLTVQQVAEMLQLSRVTLYKLMNAGQLPSVKVGGSRRVSEATLHRFLDSLERPEAS